MIQITPVILCGGSGTRLWPLSRAGFPKQFLSLTGNESLFQQAAQRLVALGADDIQVAKPLIVTGEEHRFLASEQLREVGIELGAALLEPVGRNTAPALTLAALAAQQNSSDPVLVVTPADQTLADTTAFTQAMQQAVRVAEQGSIVILGITPNRPETGYGYIQTSPSLRGEAEAIHPVQRFVEKPDTATAQQYLAEGGYFWNAGMFVLKASTWLKALDQFRPDILQATTAAWASRNTDANPATPFVRPGKAEFTAIPPDSIDYAVMERCPGSAFTIKMVPLDAGWSDLGAWDAVWNVLPKDEHGNAHVGDVLTSHSHNTLVRSSRMSWAASAPSRPTSCRAWRAPRSAARSSMSSKSCLGSVIICRLSSCPVSISVSLGDDSKVKNPPEGGVKSAEVRVLSAAVGARFL